MDAGLIAQLHWDVAVKPIENLYKAMQFTTNVALTYIGDMGLESKYDQSLYFDSVKVYESKSFFLMTNETLSPLDCRSYSRLEYLDKIYIYSDYSPRWQGDEHFTQPNQPSVDVSLHRLPNMERRVTYRDRRYVLPGFAYQEDFYHPDYKRNPPREGQKDYRRTLYWNPDLKPDEEGKAHIRLFNGSQATAIQVEAEGMTAGGGFLYNKPKP